MLSIRQPAGGYANQALQKKEGGHLDRPKVRIQNDRDP
jgi:hypothetical protein